MKIKKHIPNTITCGNLFCGCLAIVYALNGNLVWSAYLVGIAAILDFLDGFVARILNVHSEIGKELDSLADMITFGVVPGVVMFMMLSDVTQIVDNPVFYFSQKKLISFLGFLITIFSAIRLAKFNIDTRQTLSFIGVPTPANSILICSIPIINYFQPQFLGCNVLLITENFYFLIALTLIMSFLLIAELPLFALKFKTFGWSENKIRYLFLIISIILLILFQFVGIPIIIFLYIVLSIINNLKTKNEIQSRN